MRRIRRILLVLSVVLVLLVVVAVVALRLYLASPQATARAAAKLEAVYGAPVGVGRLDVGLHTTQLHNLQLFEAGAGEGAEPWARVEDVQADVSLWELLRGDANPQHLDLTGASVTLRFDREGRLLTQLPAGKTKATTTVPVLQLRQSRVTIQQEGRPDFVVDGVDAEVQTHEGQLVLNGHVTNAQWGSWTVDGTYNPQGGGSSGTLKAQQQVHVTQAMLSALPFVPGYVWQQVQAEGDATGELTLSYVPSSKAFHSRVDVLAEKTHVQVSSIDLDATEAHGRVIVDDSVVRLRDVQGQTADGQISTTGDLDFSSTPNRLAFQVKAKDLDIDQLPRKWHLPRGLKGRLTGHADLVVTVRDGRPHTTGEGRGEISQATVIGFKAEPIQLRLRADEEGFHYSTEDAPAEETSRPVLPAWLALATVLAVPGTDTVAQAPATPPAPAANQPTYLEANLTLEDVDIAEAVRRLKLRLSVPVSGHVSLHVRASIPLDTPEDMKTYRLRGTVTARQLDVAGLEVDDASAHLVYDNGVLTLEELRGKVPPLAQPETGTQAAGGSFSGSARMGIIPAGDLSARLTLTSIPLDRLGKMFPDVPAQPGGTISATAEARAPAEHLQDLTTWTASGNLTSERLQAFGLTLTGFRADFRLAEGVLSAPTVAGRLEGAALDGSAELHLTDTYSYRAELGVKRGDLAALQRLVPEFRPPFPVGGTIEGTASVRGGLKPLTWKASGSLTADELLVDTLRIGSVKFRWTGDPDRLEITDLTARLYKGDVTGSATLPLSLAASPAKEDTRPAAAGAEGHVDLDFKAVDLGPLVRALQPPPAPAPGKPATTLLEGQASGTLKGKITPGAAGKPPDIRARVDLKAPTLRARGIPMQKVEGTLNYRNGVTDYNLDGDVLGGRFQLQGQYPGRADAPANPPADRPADRPAEERRPARPSEAQLIPIHQAPAPAPAEEGTPGRLRIEGAQLGRLWELLGLSTDRVPLHGRLDVDLPFRYDPRLGPVGTGTFILRRLRWQQSEVGTVRGTLRLTGQEVRVTDVTGTLAEGVVRGDVVYPLSPTGRGWFSVTLERIELSRLLAPWPDLAAQFQGPLDIRLRGRLGSEWSGEGTITLVRGRVAGVEVSEWRVPIDFLFSPTAGYARVDVRDSSAQVAHGRLTARASLTLNGARHLEGSAQFYDIELGTLLRESSEQGLVGSGRLSGRLEFGANDLRSLNDLTATLTASFGQAQATGIPVLQQALPYLGVGLSSTSFRSGDLRARLDRGVIRVQRLTLSGNFLQLVAQGTVTLIGERLNLDVWAHTGQLLPDTACLRLLGLGVPAVGPIPLGVILEASNYFSNRTIHLVVTGTIRNPSVRIEPVALLSEEAVRFFLNQTGVPIPGAVIPSTTFPGGSQP